MGTEVELTDFSVRLAAHFIDAFILIFGWYIIHFLFLLFFVLASASEEMKIIASYLGLYMYIIGFPLLVVLYFALFESSKYQGALGKILLKIKVVDRKGKRLRFGQALGRSLGKILSTLILFIGYLMALWTENKQTLHDYLSSTYVVSSKRL
ncbi:MAG: RDD family protein [Saprospirales bacterium]|nr:MAG: RDD family protein [Saprospirales bacterium]